MTDNQHNSNTILQATSLQSTKGPLNTMFNLQGLRTIKAIVKFNNWISGIPITQDACVLNQYDGTPIKLHSTDIILLVILGNGNTCLENSASSTSTGYRSTTAAYLKYVFPIPFESGTVTLYLGKKPTYNQGSYITNWTPNMEGSPKNLGSLDLTTLQSAPYFFSAPYPASNYISLTSNNTVGSINNSNNTCYSGVYEWLNCQGNNINLSLTNQQAEPTILLTLLVLNPIISQ
jgi:hypothetical protein